MDKMGKNTKKIALSAILSAAGVVLLFFGSLVEVLDLSSAAAAGFVVVIAVIELGKVYPVMIYLAVSVLAALTLPSKFPAVFFIFFGGSYPLCKYHFERYHPAIAWVLKFSMFNMALAYMIVFVKFLVLPDDTYLADFFANFKIVVYAVANVVFLLYDVAMTRIICLYIVKIRKIMGFKNYF